MSKTLLKLFICFLALNSSLIQAQEFQVGLKGGINKTFGGEITGKTPIIYAGNSFEATGEIGFHGGIWTQINFGDYFIRPEVIYSKLQSRFDFPQGPSLYEVEELSVPVLFGYNILEPLDIYAGAAFKKIISSTLERLAPVASPPDVVVQDTHFYAQVGTKVEFGSFGLDVRYEHTLSSKPFQPINFVPAGSSSLASATFEDARLNQLIVSLTLKLWDSENTGKRRRRGGNCYFR